MKTFLMTYQSFTSPEILLTKLIQRYQVPRTSTTEKMDEETWKSTQQKPIQLRSINVVKNWVEKHYSDFNEKLIAQLNSFIDVQLIQDGNKSLQETLRNTLAKKEKEELGASSERIHTFKELPPEPKIMLKTLFAPDLSWVDIDEEEIARQLTLIEFGIFQAIQPSELLNQAWSRPRLRHRSPNVLKMIHRFNDFSLFVASSIVKQDKVKNRAKIMAKFIRIAEHLKNLKNFNCVIAILSGIGNSAVHRLKWTKEEMDRRSQNVLIELQKSMSSEQSYKNYRETLQSIVPPCIPYLGVYLTDLTFIEEGNPDMIGNLINFTKRKLIYNVIFTIQQYQSAPYNLQPIIQIQQFFNKFQKLPKEQDLFVQSLEKEPRGAERTLIQ